MTHAYNEADICHYDRIRQVLTDLYPKFFSEITREALERCAKRLNVFFNNGLLLNTEHESKILFDYIFYNHKISGNTLMKRSFQKFSNQYDGENFDIFKAASEAFFAYTVVLEPVGEEALRILNPLTQEMNLLIDRGLNRTSKSKGKYAIVSHLINFGKFLMTTGAAIPVSIESLEGNKIEERFLQYFKQSRQGSVSSKESLQYVADMYRLCFEEDITGLVSSPDVPFGEEALKARVPGAFGTKH